MVSSRVLLIVRWPREIIPLAVSGEDRHPALILAFAGACALATVYGFLQGAWPFGVVETIWAGVAMRRWWVKSHL
jgi:hypothetical protein